MKYLRRTTSAAANHGLSTTIIPPCSAASFELNSEPHIGVRPSVRLCVGPEFARCVHFPIVFKKDTHHISPCLSFRRASVSKNLRHNPLLLHYQSNHVPRALVSYCCPSGYYKIKYFLTPKSGDRLQLVMFLIGDAQLRASSSFASPNSFFIGAHGQEF
jgi:hypothetical protein